MKEEHSSLARIAFAVAALTAFAAAVFVRFGDLSADPALNLSRSAGVLFDPFSHSGNARSFLLFGDLHPDQWNTYIYSPLYVLLQTLWFNLFGISVATMHGYGATWSLLAIITCWFCFRNFGRLSGVLALILFGSHYVFSQLGRIALLENAAVFATLIAMLTLSRRLTNKRAFLCGFAGFLIFTIKGTIFYAVPAIGLAVLVSTVQQYLDDKNWKAGTVTFGMYLLGTLAAFLPWLFLFRIPNNAEISWLAPVWWRSVNPGNWENALNFLINDQLFGRISPHDFTSVVMLITIGVTLYRLLTNWRKLQPVAVMLMFYFVFGAIFVGLLRYKPTRFCEPLIPPLLGLCVIGLVDFCRGCTLTRSFKRWWAADLSGVLTLTLILRMKFYLHGKPRALLQMAEFGVLPGQWDSLLACFLFSLFGWIAIRVALRALKQSYEVPIPVRHGLVALFIAHFLWANLSQSYSWWKVRDHSIRDASRALNEFPHMVIGGLSVHALVMETTHRAVRIEHGGWHNSAIGNRIFTDLGLTHFLLTDYNNQRAEYFQRYKKEMPQLKKIKVFHMCGQKYHLYSIPKNIVLSEPSPKKKRKPSGKRKRKKGQQTIADAGKIDRQQSLYRSFT